jgi:hypothetical protein
MSEKLFFEHAAGLDELDAGFDALVVTSIHGLESMWTPNPRHPILAAREAAVANLDALGCANQLPNLGKRDKRNAVFFIKSINQCSKAIFSVNSSS